MKLDLTREQRRQFGEWLKNHSNLKQSGQQSIAQSTIALSEDTSGNSVLIFAENIGELLKNSDPTVRLKALNYLLERGRQLDIVPVNDIVECLQDEDKAVRKAVVDNLWDFEKCVNDALIAKILSMLHDKNPGIVATAIQVLTEFWDRLDDEAIRTVISNIGRQDKAVQVSALKAIARFIGTCEHTVEMLEEGLIYDLIGMIGDDNLRPDVFEILDYIGAELKEETIHKIADMLYGEDPLIRDSAAEFLSLTGHGDLIGAVK